MDQEKSTNGSEHKINELTDLLRRALEIYEEDRDRAIANHNQLRTQLDNILNSFDMSEDCKLEAEVNKAVKLVFESANRLDGIIRSITYILVNQLNAEVKERIADKFMGMGEGAKTLTAPVNITKLLDERK